MTFEEISDKIRKLTKEAEAYLANATHTNNKWVHDCQMMLYKSTKSKIAQLEELI